MLNRFNREKKKTQVGVIRSLKSKKGKEYNNSKNEKRKKNYCCQNDT